MRDPADPSPGSDADTAVLARRIARLARTAQAGFIPAIARLHRSLQASLPEADAKPLLRALQDMHHAVTDAQCRSGGRRWLRWWPWRARGPAAEAHYVLQCREALATRRPATERCRQLAGASGPRATEAARQLSQMSEMVDGLDVPLQEAQGLLERLWEGLKPQRPDPADPGTADQLRALLADVDTQRALVQRLEGTCGAARDVVRLGRAVLAGRETLLGLLADRFDKAWDDWRVRAEPVLGEGLAPDLVAALARQAAAPRRALLQQLEHARTACTRLQIDEQALAQALVHLGEQLAALGDPPVSDEPTVPGHRIDTRS